MRSDKREKIHLRKSLLDHGILRLTSSTVRPLKYNHRTKNIEDLEQGNSFQIGDNLLRVFIRKCVSNVICFFSFSKLR